MIFGVCFFAFISADRPQSRFLDLRRCRRWSGIAISPVSITDLAAEQGRTSTQAVASALVLRPATAPLPKLANISSSAWRWVPGGLGDISCMER